MSSTRRLAIVGVALVVVVIAAVVLSKSGGDSSTSSATGGPATVTVRAGKPVGGVQKITYKKGGTVDLTVKSDTADEVHFHGYDVHKDVARGGTVRFRFPASIEGRFVVELEDHKQTLAEVTVEP
jgi:FlaG/FlaF family flagellin (archaellin)